MGDSTDETSPACLECSDPVDETEQRRIVSVVEDGKAVHYHFCSKHCLDRWDGSD
jgi:hypothetical protein